MALFHLKLIWLTLVFMIFTTSTSFGTSSIEMLLWSPEGESSPKILIAKKSTETEQQAVTRYLDALTSHTYSDPRYKSTDTRISHLFSDDQLQNLAQSKPLQTFSTFEKNSLASGGKALVGLIANSAEDMLGGERIRRNSKMFETLNSRPVVIGMGADLGLSVSEQIEFRSLVADNVDLLVALGGDDISPEIYGDADHNGAVNTNLQRDIFEIGLIRTFKEKQKGFFFGICRGHQLGAIADGHSMKQDISQIDGAHPDTHRFRSPLETADGAVSDHNTRSQTNHNNILQGDSLLRQLLGIQGDKFEVNSIHHQAIHFNSNAGSFAVAISEVDHIVEALEQNNGRGLSVQWHPEFWVINSLHPEFRLVMERLMRGLVEHALTLSRSSKTSPGVAGKTCKSVLN